MQSLAGAVFPFVVYDKHPLFPLQPLPSSSSQVIMFSAVLHQKQNIVFLSHQRQLFSSAEGTYLSLSARMGTSSSLVHCPSCPSGEATCSSLHLQYCAFQSQVKAVNLGLLFDSQKETLVLPKSQTSEGSGSICFQILRAQRHSQQIPLPANTTKARIIKSTPQEEYETT